jgi:hypothetical protein
MMRWRFSKNTYGDESYRGFLGLWNVTTITRLEDESLYIVECHLPGYKNPIDKSEDIEIAKQLASRVIERWIDLADPENNIISTRLH